MAYQDPTLKGPQMRIVEPEDGRRISLAVDNNLAARTSSINFLTAVPETEGRAVQGVRGFHDQPAAAEGRRPKQLIEKAQHTSVNRPVGILAIHIKHVNFADLNPTDSFMQRNLSVYLRICVGKQIKCTCEYEGVITPTKVIMDELKHFSVQVSPSRSDPSNYMRLEVVAFEKQQHRQHFILGMKEIHIYEIMKRLYTVDNVEIYKRDKYIADIELEFCFSYGTYGYGYSNQFESRQKTPKELVQHSMFYRPDPPLSRKDGHRNVMLPRPVGHPPFIYFGKKVEIGDTVTRYKSDMSIHDWEMVEEPVLLISRIRRKMHRQYTEYSDQPNRKARLEYLRDMMQNHASPSNINEGVMLVSEKFRLHRRQHSTQKTLHVGNNDQEDRLAFSIDDMTNVTKVMEQAPGILDRRREAKNRGNDSASSQKREPRRRSSSVVHAISRILGTWWNPAPDDTDTSEGPPTANDGADASRSHRKSMVSKLMDIWSPKSVTNLHSSKEPKLVLPRVMITPPSPVYSSDEDYDYTDYHLT